MQAGKQQRFEEARGRPIEDVFVIVDSQTRQPRENSVRQSLETRDTVELSNHTLLLTQLLGRGVTAESTPGQGSAFTVTIDASPVAFATQKAASLETAEIRGEAAKPAPAGSVRLEAKILLAEDAPDNQCPIGFL